VQVEGLGRRGDWCKLKANVFFQDLTLLSLPSPSPELVSDVLSLVVLPAVDKVEPRPGSFLPCPPE
jgi:hypothetical protein